MRSPLQIFCLHRASYWPADRPARGSPVNDDFIVSQKTTIVRRLYSIAFVEVAEISDIQRPARQVHTAAHTWIISRQKTRT